MKYIVELSYLLNESSVSYIHVYYIVKAKDMIDAFFNRIGETLESGVEVKISGFGNFQLRNKTARPGRNPKTGEMIPIAARRVVTFHASQKLKDAVESHAQNQNRT